MGKSFRRPNRPATIALSVIAVILAATVYAFVSLSQRATPDNAGPPPTQKPPAASAQPTVNTANFASTSPAATTCSHPVSLQATGAWMAGYNDDKQNTGEVPSGAAQFGVLDFDWLTFSTPGSLTSIDPFSQSLSTVLSTDAQANPCTLRFVTITDQSAPASKKVMAEI